MAEFSAVRKSLVTDAGYARRQFNALQRSIVKTAIRDNLDAIMQNYAPERTAITKAAEAQFFNVVWNNKFFKTALVKGGQFGHAMR